MPRWPSSRPAAGWRVVRSASTGFVSGRPMDGRRGAMSCATRRDSSRHRDWVGEADHAARRSGRGPGVPGAPAAAGIRDRRSGPAGPAVCHGPRPPPGDPQRATRQRRPARPGLDTVREATASPMPTTSPTCSSAARTCSARPWATAGIADASVGRRRRAGRGTAPRSPSLPSSRSRWTARSVTIATDDEWRASTGEIRCRRPVRRLPDRPPRAPRRLGPAGIRCQRLGTGRGRALRPLGHRATGRAAGPRDRHPPVPSSGDAGRRLAARQRPERLRVGALAGPRGRRVGRHRPPRRGPRTRWVVAHPFAAIRARDRHLRPRGRRRGRSRTGLHVPRVPLRGGPRRRRDRGRGGRGHQLGRRVARTVHLLGAAPRAPPRERPLVAARQLRLGADRLPPAGRTARLDR